ncbi:MAG: carboxypeptidase-like regulatory domain-containing protein, partial [Bryobacteraceae bacterium]
MRFILLAGLHLLAVSSAAAQQRAQLFGAIRDSSGAVIQNAAVSVLEIDTGIRRSARSNPEGFYAISSLSPGRYKVTVRKDGFRTVARLGVRLEATQTGRLDFLLEIGNMHETVTVEGGAALVNT